jgi:hypothetical protein
MKTLSMSREKRGRGNKSKTLRSSTVAQIDANKKPKRGTTDAGGGSRYDKLHSVGAKTASKSNNKSKETKATKSGQLNMVPHPMAVRQDNDDNDEDERSEECEDSDDDKNEDGGVQERSIENEKSQEYSSDDEDSEEEEPVEKETANEILPVMTATDGRNQKRAIGKLQY